MKAFLDKLAELDAPLNPPATEEEIQKAEQRIGLQLPESLRELYSYFNGTSAEFEDDALWLFWSLEAIGTIRQLYSHRSLPTLSKYGDDYPDQYIIFADALIGAPLYAVCADPKSSSYGEVIFIFIDSDFAIYPSAPSFKRFQELFLASPSEWAIEDTTG